MGMMWRAGLRALLFILAALTGGVTARNYRLSPRHNAVGRQPCDHHA
jgi:hypothetical protein